VYLPRKYWLI